MKKLPSAYCLASEVARARAVNAPVVALETTVITHGLPEPENLKLANDMEVQVRANGAVPARKSAIVKSELYAEGGPLNIFVQQLEGGVALERPVTPAYPVITAAFSDAVNNIVAGADVKTELDKAVEKIDQDIEDNQGYPIQ